MYRLNVFSITLPPLRDRIEDIPLLARHFIHLFNGKHAAQVSAIRDMAMDRLQQWHWPGNVRELRNVAERYVLGLEDLPVGGSGSSGETLEARMDRVERAILVDSLAEQDGRIGTTADALGISRKTLYLKMRKHGLGGEEEA